MLTTLDIDRKLLDAVGEETESGAVNEVLREYLRWRIFRIYAPWRAAPESKIQPHVRESLIESVINSWSEFDTVSMVIADTSVWLNYINRPESPSGRTLDSYLTDGDVQMVGPVLTEILQGCVSQSDYDFWASRLAEMSFIDADKDTWLVAS